MLLRKKLCTVLELQACIYPCHHLNKKHSAKYTQNKSTFSVLKSLFSKSTSSTHTLFLSIYSHITRPTPHSPCFQSCFVSDSFIAFLSEMFKSNHCLWVLGLYFDRYVGLYYDGVGVLVLVSMQNQVVWGLIAEFLFRLLWWVWSLICLNIGCWFEVEDKKDGFINYVIFFLGFDCVVHLYSKARLGFCFWYGKT